MPFEQQIDAIFILNRCSLINLGKDSGVGGIRKGETQKFQGYLRIGIDKTAPIANLLTWLSYAMIWESKRTSPMLNYLSFDA